MNENLEHINKAIYEINKIKMDNDELNFVLSSLKLTLSKLKERVSDVSGAKYRAMHVQTDCSKCIYLHNEKISDLVGGTSTISFCRKDMRTTKPFCPIFDDGKDVKR